MTGVTGERARRYRESGLWNDELVVTPIRRQFAEAAGRCAVVDGTRRLGYAELGDAVGVARDRLAGLGVRPGDRIAVALTNCAEYVVLVLAALELGAAPVLILPAFREHELDHVVAVTGPVLLAVDATGRRKEALTVARRLRERHAGLKNLLVRGGETVGDEVDLALLCEPGGETPSAWKPAAAPSDPAVFLLSGGTTGLPKAIARTHEGYGCMIRHAITVNAMTRDAVNLVVMPAEHGFVMNCPGILGALSVGATVVMSSPESPSGAFEIIERERVTHSTLVPSVALRWSAEAKRTSRDLSSLRVLLVGGSRLAPGTADELRTTLGGTVQQCYGMSEGLLCYTRLDDPDDVIRDTQGRPLLPEDEIRVVAADGSDVEPGAEGELLTRGPYTVAGYYANPEATAEAFTPDGFYRTGDLVRVGPGGNLEILGRIRDVINRGGEKISAEELEAMALRHPSIAQAAGVAVPHEIHGETVCLCVVPAAGAERPGLREVRKFLDGQGLARYKFPEHLVVLDALPLTGTGKVDKAALRRDAAGSWDAAMLSGARG